jgi:hypothetical protein
MRARQHVGSPSNRTAVEGRDIARSTRTGGTPRARRAARRRGWCLAWCGALCSIALSGTASALTPLTQQFTDREGRFSIAFPADWTVVSTPAGDTAVTGFAPDNRKVRGVIPAATGGVLSVSIDRLPSEMSVVDYGERSSRGMATTFGNVGFNLIEQGPAKVSNRDAYFQYFTTATLYQLQTYVIVGRALFVINGSCPNDPAITARDVPAFVKITNTFRTR